MIKQSDLALAAWKATERTLDAVVTINKIDYKTTDIASISYDAGGYTGDTFGIGSNYENSVTIKFAHLIEGLKPGMTVWPKIGIKTSNGYEYNSLGLFIVSDDIQMDRNNDETTIRAYDQMCLLEGTYTSKLTYPAKMTSVIAEIANLAGVLLNTTDISRLPVQVNLPSAITGQTYRNAIGMIAQFYAGFVTFDRDGKLTIRTIAEPDYTLDPSQYEQGGLTKNEAPYKIGGIQCEVTTTTTDSTGQSTETTNTLQVGATSGSQIKLTNNLMTMDRLTSIWQQLQSLTFYPFSLNWFGNPAIEAGDWLTLQDTKGNKFNVPNNGYTMTFDGSLSAVSKADQTSTSSSSYAWRGELSQYVADLGGRQGASGNYIYGTDTTEPPYGAKFNDIWYKQNGNKVELWTYERQADGTGKWVLTVSDATGEEVKAKVDQVELEAKASTDAAKAASDKADQLAAKYDDTNSLANQAMDKAVGAQSDASIAVAKAESTASAFGPVKQSADSALSAALNAQGDASSAVAKAESTASEFGKVSQKTDSAAANAMSAQASASEAVKQASSAAADSKDAKQIAGAVSQSYKTLTDGSTMTIAELESGLAAKLTKTDLDGYATQTWSQNQIKMTADGINGTMSSIKSTVDGQTTSINDLKADSSSFKSQFTTVNNTIGKHTTDIGTLQASSKELSSNFSSLSTDNNTNKHDISQLKQTAEELSGTLAKKIEQKDLNGYATQTWTQTQIKITSDSLSGSLSSIKSTVDGQTTSINDLKADSSSFKSQFTTVNNTIGKHTTDIGTLQTTSNELTSNFNSLDSDNTTNKNDISQLKQTATEISSTVTSVSDKVNNLQIGGRNYFLDSKTRIITPPGTANWDWRIYITDSFWANPNRLKSNNIKISFTLSAEKALVTDFNSLLFFGEYPWYAKPINYPAGTTSPQKYELIFNITDSAFKAGNCFIRFQAKDTSDFPFVLENAKLEIGTKATDWSPAPEDMATVTAVSKISQTVDSIKTDISKKIEQKDLNGYATQTWTQTQIKTTSDGINGTISSVKSTVDGHTTSINTLKADSSGFKAQFTTVNNTLGKQTTDIGTLQSTTKSLSASFDSLNTDNGTNKHDISQLQQTAKSFSSTLMTVQQQVTDSSVGTNLLANTADNGVGPVTIQGDTSAPQYSASMTRNSSYIEMTKPTMGSEMYYRFCNTDSSMHNLKPGQTYTIQGEVYVSKGAVRFRSQYEVNGGWTDYPGCQSGDLATNTSGFVKVKYTFTIRSNATAVYISWQVFNFDSSTVFRFRRMKLEIGSNATDYSTSPLDNATVTAVSSISQTIDSIQTTVRGKVDNDTYQSDVKQLSGQIESVVKKNDDNWSAIQQNASDISLRVEKKGVINAVNISTEGIQIYGNKLHITATTYIDDAVIKDAMIDTINAEKITTGALDATKVNVINLNANNITTGTLSGDNLQINLNTGVVTFQHGRIHNAGNTIDINIDAGYMSVANGSNRVMLKNGEMQFVQPGIYDTSDNPYLRISNTFGGQSTEGAAFIGRKYAVLTNSDNATGNEMFDIGLGTEKFSGIATGYGAGVLNSGWHMTKVGGADRGVVISGGKATSYRQYWSASPSIMVGATQTSTHSGGMNGSNIIMDCDYLYNFSTWMRTSSHAANVYVADDGAIVRASSASKYKTNIERSFDIGMGERILEVPTAHWFDKAEVRKKTLDPQAPDPRRYFGMIADDLDDAGLTELVEYNDKGEVEGLMYDRIALTIIPIVRNYRDRITKLESEIKQLKEG
ncbi:gp58-like family protein [Lactiplantibacillus plantarum]|uniref:gp58-like family protein n=1 Tax=Lactiplantibacillus plantarum TaxID=1590 RepID=UPI00223F7844|nr:gp58-like family protein [Lactiplantibacillus plantarum]